MATLTATDARREFFDVVKGATEKHQVYRIHHRRGSVVLMAEDDYDSLIETMELLSSPGFRPILKKSVEQMHRGETVSFSAGHGGQIRPQTRTREDCWATHMTPNGKPIAIMACLQMCAAVLCYLGGHFGKHIFAVLAGGDEPGPSIMQVCARAGPWLLLVPLLWAEWEHGPGNWGRIVGEAGRYRS